MRNGGFGAIVLVLCVSACAQFPYREKGLDPVKAECPPTFYSNYSDGQKIDDAVLDGDQGDCWKRSIEEHASYDLMFVEFDDQGWVQQSSKLPRPGDDYLDVFFAQLEKLRARYQRAGRALSLVVYVHGWHHNAHANDENVRAFRKLLGDVALAEGEGGTARRVVGIYIGWQHRRARVSRDGAGVFFEVGLLPRPRRKTSGQPRNPNVGYRSFVRRFDRL